VEIHFPSFHDPYGSGRVSYPPAYVIPPFFLGGKDQRLKHSVSDPLAVYRGFPDEQRFGLLVTFPVVFMCGYAIDPVKDPLLEFRLHFFFNKIPVYGMSILSAVASRETRVVVFFRGGRTTSGGNKIVAS